MNFLIHITPDCDCFPFSDTSIVPDIGILASKDPEAIDAVRYDLETSRPGVPIHFSPLTLIKERISSGEFIHRPTGTDS